MSGTRAGLHATIVATLALALPPAVSDASVGPTGGSLASPPAAAGAGAAGGDRTERRLCPRWGQGAECGNLPRAWDPTGEVPGKLGVGFIFWPATDTSQPPLGTIVAHEGGPGYAASRSSPSYIELMGPLLGRRNLLVVDQRGTGRSEPIDCPELQDLVGEYADAAAICGERLGDHAHLYGTDLAADDMAAVIESLGVAPVDLYGDSYGTFFAQVFTGRHPDLVRTVTLDAAYPTYGEDAWYDTQAPALNRALDAVCERSAWCPDGGSSARLEQVVELLRAEGPIDGVAPAADGLVHRVRLDAPTLAFVAYAGTYVPTTYRELDAGLRAALDGDWLPLLRLLAEANYPGGAIPSPRAYSEGLDAAVSCRDYPQVFDLMAPPDVREEQLEAAITAKEASDPLVYAPFTVREQVDSEWLTIDWCTGWPVPPPAYAPAPPEPPSGSYPVVPVLVLSGELDTITTAAEGELVAAQFPTATFIEVANALHVTALGDLNGCASGIVRAFVANAAVGDTSCAASQPPVHAAPPFWATVAEADPAMPKGSLAADADSLRAASVATATVADALARWWQSYETGGRGLRGGEWTGGGYHVVRLRLTDYELANDLEVTGSVDWRRAGGRVSADVTVAGAAAGTLHIHWNAATPDSVATIRGDLDGSRVRATMLAP